MGSCLQGSCLLEAWEDAQNHQDTEYVYGAAKHPGAVTKTVYPGTAEHTGAGGDATVAADLSIGTMRSGTRPCGLDGL